MEESEDFFKYLIVNFFAQKYHSVAEFMLSILFILVKCWNDCCTATYNYLLREKDKERKVEREKGEREYGKPHGYSSRSHSTRKSVGQK